MGYIENIRKLVGSKPIILNSSGVFLFNDKNEMMLVYREDTKNWGLPGGYMEPGETFDQTIKRELYEELNIQVLNLEFYDIYSGQEFYHEYPNGDQVYSVIALYKAEHLSGDIKVDNKEISEVMFFSPEKIPPTITKTTRKLLELYYAH